MLSKKRQRNYNSSISFKNNFPMILLTLVLCVILYSIIEHHFFSDKPPLNNREHNLEQVRKFNLKDLYNQKNLNHNQVRIWILNNTDQTGLAGKMRDCFEKGYKIENKKIKGDYTIFRQDNFKNKDRYDLGKINADNTQVFIHVDIEQNPKFKTHIQEFLSFTGFKSDILQYEYNEKLYQERDITIILGNDWNANNNLVYCKESIN
tara:strand:- start:7761 stop:8378 length:618 start_codon:yes stop_codon:yes gene_type:complete